MPISPSPTPTPRVDAATELSATALRLFVEQGYAGASLQQIADAAGYSKSSVLYHFASKEALLEAALKPAVDRIGAILENFVDRLSNEELRAEFITEFIDFLLEYRLEAHIIILQGQSLSGIPTLDRASGYINQLADSFMTEVPSVAQRIRLGVALAGVAYVLAMSAALASGPAQDDPTEVREALVAVLTDITRPLPPHTA